MRLTRLSRFRIPENIYKRKRQVHDGKSLDRGKTCSALRFNKKNSHCQYISIFVFCAQQFNN